jgi:hypothetical protein
VAVHANAPLLGDARDNDRLTVVAYFREDMLKLGSWEEEVTKEAFVSFARVRGIKITKESFSSKVYLDFKRELEVV